MYRFVEICNSLFAVSEIEEISFEVISKENEPPFITNVKSRFTRHMVIHVYLKNGKEKTFKVDYEWEKQKEEIIKALTRC